MAHDDTYFIYIRTGLYDPMPKNKNLLVEVPMDVRNIILSMATRNDLATRAILMQVFNASKALRPWMGSLIELSPKELMFSLNLAQETMDILNRSIPFVMRSEYMVMLSALSQGYLRLFEWLTTSLPRYHSVMTQLRFMLCDYKYPKTTHAILYDRFNQEDMAPKPKKKKFIPSFDPLMDENQNEEEEQEQEEDAMDIDQVNVNTLPLWLQNDLLTERVDLDRCIRSKKVAAILYRSLVQALGAAPLYGDLLDLNDQLTLQESLYQTFNTEEGFKTFFNPIHLRYLAAKNIQLKSLTHPRLVMRALDSTTKTSEDNIIIMSNKEQYILLNHVSHETPIKLDTFLNPTDSMFWRTHDFVSTTILERVSNFLFSDQGLMVNQVFKNESALVKEHYLNILCSFYTHGNIWLANKLKLFFEKVDYSLLTWRDSILNAENGTYGFSKNSMDYFMQPVSDAEFFNFIRVPFIIIFLNLNFLNSTSLSSKIHIFLF